MLEYDKVKLGRILKAAREEAEMTQAEISNRLGYTSSQFISNIERGTSVAPLRTLSKMMAIYKVDIGPVVKLILDSQRQILRKKLMGAGK